jgi:hypothetical protein
MSVVTNWLHHVHIQHATSVSASLVSSLVTVACALLMVIIDYSNWTSTVSQAVSWSYSIIYPIILHGARSGMASVRLQPPTYSISRTPMNGHNGSEGSNSSGSHLDCLRREMRDKSLHCYIEWDMKWKTLIVRSTNITTDERKVFETVYTRQVWSIFQSTWERMWSLKEPSSTEGVKRTQNQLNNLSLPCITWLRIAHMVTSRMKWYWTES